MRILLSNDDGYFSPGGGAPRPRLEITVVAWNAIAAVRQLAHLNRPLSLHRAGNAST
jgi:broad specificity polyphosphatase/5'/3'-nucleotidase SurE